MKVVINACYGGFGVSDEALLKLIEQESETVNKIPFSKWCGDSNINTYEDYCKSKHCIPSMEFEKRGDFYFSCSSIGAGTLYDDHHAYTLKSVFEFENLRHHPDLIAVIEEMGKGANSRFSNLKIVEIPDDVDYEIDEYDGMEHVAETHRTWS